MSAIPVVEVTPAIGASPSRRRPSLRDGRGRAWGAVRVLLVEQRLTFAAVLMRQLRWAAADIARTASMTDAGHRRPPRSVDLLILNVDRTDEASWLRAAEYRRRHPGVGVWVYTRWSSPVDATLAGFVPVEKLIYYDGRPRELAEAIGRHLLARGGAPGAAPRTHQGRPRRPAAAT